MQQHIKYADVGPESYLTTFLVFYADVGPESQWSYSNQQFNQARDERGTRLTQLLMFFDDALFRNHNENKSGPGQYKEQDDGTNSNFCWAKLILI